MNKETTLKIWNDVWPMLILAAIIGGIFWLGSFLGYSAGNSKGYNEGYKMGRYEYERDTCRTQYKNKSLNEVPVLCLKHFDIDFRVRGGDNI